MTRADGTNWIEIQKHPADLVDVMLEGAVRFANVRLFPDFRPQHL